MSDESTTNTTEDAELAQDGASEDPADEPVGAQLHGAAMTSSFGQTVLHVDVEHYLELMTTLRDAGFNQAIDLCGVDAIDLPRPDVPASVPTERFEVVVNLINYSSGERLRVRAQVADGAEIPTLFDLWPGTEAMEREAFDMFGIVFGDHPDMSRILMPEDWVGFPLRKDFDIGRIPVQFKDAPGRS